jgi:hypothetical protein
VRRLPATGQTARRRRPAGGKFVSARAPAPEKPPAPVAAPPSHQDPEFRYRDKLNVYGREEEVDLSRDDLRRELQISRAASARMKEIAQRERAVLEFDEGLKANTRAALEAKGIDPVEFARQVLSEHAKRELMSPEERRAFEAEQKLAEFEQREKAQQETMAKQAEQQRASKLWEHIRPQFDAALAEAGIPRNRFTLAEIAKVGTEFLDIGLILDPKAVVAEAKKRIQGGHEAYLGSLDAKTLRAKLGKEKLRELMALEVEEWKASQDFHPAPQREQVAIPAKREERQYIDEYEFARRRRGG